MRSSTGRRAAALAAVVILGFTAACGAGSPFSTASGGPAPSAAVPQDLQPATLIVPDALKGKFDPHQVLIPAGWTMSVWAAVPDARLAAWTPDGALLVSRPGEGQVVRLTPERRTRPPRPSSSTGSRSRTGSPSTAPRSTSPRATGSAPTPTRRALRPVSAIVADGLPDAKSPELGGQYAHALKTVAVGPDHALYFSIGSSGNTSADDRDATPQRASIMRIPPGGGPPTVFARGVRNGTGLAIAPDGSVWTAVNNRDNIAYPFDAAFGDAKESSQGEVIDAYVNDHPAEELAKLTAGRDLGWPYCNPDPDVHPGDGRHGVRVHHPAVRQRHRDQRRRREARLREPSPGSSRASARTRRRSGSASTAGLPAPYNQGALVGIHGSWNRTPPRAPEVSYFPWANGTLGPQRTLVGGFQDATATGGADRWRRSWVPTARSTSPTTTPMRFTGWPRRDADL